MHNKTKTNKDIYELFGTKILNLDFLFSMILIPKENLN